MSEIEDEQRYQAHAVHLPEAGEEEAPGPVEVMQRNRLAYEIACDLWNRVGVKHGAEDYLWGRVEQVVEERVGPLIQERDEAREALAEARREPMKVALCEVAHIYLHPDTLYEFYVAPDCRECAALADAAEVRATLTPEEPPNEDVNNA